MNKIKLSISIFLAAWLLSTSLLAQSTSWSRGTFGNVGYIGSLKSDSIIIDDSRYRLSATAKFSRIDNSDAGLDQVKKGQLVGYSFLVINNRFIVDHMWLIPENEKSLYRR